MRKEAEKAANEKKLKDEDSLADTDMTEMAELGKPPITSKEWLQQRKEEEAAARAKEKLLRRLRRKEEAAKATAAAAAASAASEEVSVVNVSRASEMAKSGGVREG